MSGILVRGGALLFSVALSLSLAVSIAGAQETTTGTIAGRVIDSQGLPVPGATVTVVSPGWSFRPSCSPQLVAAARLPRLRRRARRQARARPAPAPPQGPFTSPS